MRDLQKADVSYHTGEIYKKEVSKYFCSSTSTYCQLFVYFPVGTMLVSQSTIGLIMNQMLVHMERSVSNTVDMEP